MSTRGKYDRALGPRERRRGQRRALLLAASTVFARHGYAGANVEAVVKEAGMSRRTFYEHFDDLEGALAAVHEASAEFVVRHVEAELRTRAEPVQRVEHGIRTLLGLVVANPGLARVLFWEVRAAGPRFEARQQKLRGRFADMLQAELDAAHARGDVPRRAAPIAVLAIVAGIEAAGVHLATHGAPSLDDATRALVDLALGACR